MNTLPLHPLQSPAWSTFREKTGVEVVSVAPGFQMTLHPLPKIPFSIGYIPKSDVPTEKVLKRLFEIAKEKRCIFIKLEPNVIKTPNYELRSTNYDLRKSPHPLFTNYSFHIDLTKSEDELLKQMKSKTRYNTKIAQKHTITVREDDSPEGFEHYITLSKKTWERKGFRAHGEEYHRNMWEVMRKADIAHLLIAYYQPKNDERSTMNEIPLVAWILFLYKDVLYYPYGASSDEYKHTMASNLIMWEAMKWGKKHGAKLFDLWGALGPDPDKNHSWYGFHRFKEGYGGDLVEFVGSYDLVINPLLYSLYNFIHPLRQKLLNI